VAKKAFGLSDLKNVLSERGMLPYAGWRCFTDAEVVRFGEPDRQFTKEEALAIDKHFVMCDSCAKKLNAELRRQDADYLFDIIAGIIGAEEYFEEEED